MTRITTAVLFKYFWIVFILTTVANAATWWSRGREYRERDPSLAEGYRSLVIGLMTWGNLPWFIMGAGILFGGIPSITHYFNPRSSNPFIAGFFFSIIFLWVAGTYWIFARGGAEQLVRHPGLIQPSSPTAIKILWLLCLAAGVAVFTALYLGKPLGF